MGKKGEMETAELIKWRRLSRASAVGVSSGLLTHARFASSRAQTRRKKNLLQQMRFFISHFVLSSCFFFISSHFDWRLCARPTITLTNAWTPAASSAQKPAAIRCAWVWTGGPRYSFIRLPKGTGIRQKKETLRCDVSSCGYHSVLCFRPIHNVFLFTCLLQHRLLLVFQCVSNSLFARHFVLNVKTVSVSTTNVGCFVRLRRLQSGSIRADPSPLVRRWIFQLRRRFLLVGLGCRSGRPSSSTSGSESKWRAHTQRIRSASLKEPALIEVVLLNAHKIQKLMAGRATEEVGKVGDKSLSLPPPPPTLDTKKRLSCLSRGNKRALCSRTCNVVSRFHPFCRVDCAAGWLAVLLILVKSVLDPFYFTCPFCFQRKPAASSLQQSLFRWCETRVTNTLLFLLHFWRFLACR